MKKSTIGENAGVVWSTLYGKKLPWDELAAATGLSATDLATAVGWLAREDKISFLTENGMEHLEIYHENYY